MSAAGLAQFVLSQEGGIYRTICEAYGLDPGAPLLGLDDVLAQDIRTAFLLTRPQEAVREPPTDGSARVVTDLEERMRAMA